MNLFKQTFCIHVDKFTKKEKLYTTREHSLFIYTDYQYNAEYYTCLKCGRKKIIKSRTEI